MPRHDHAAPEPLIPGVPAELRIALAGCGHHVGAGSRIRVEIACMDSVVTDGQYHHAFLPTQVGTDTLHHGPAHPSRLLLPVLGRTDLPLSR